MHFFTTYESSAMGGKYGWSINVWLVKDEKGNEKAILLAGISSFVER